MKFESVGHSPSEKAMLAELLSASDALQLSRYKRFLTHPCDSERYAILDQAMEEAIHRITCDRMLGLSVRHVEGQILVSGQANSYQSRQLVIDLVRDATDDVAENGFSARIDICVNGERTEVAYAGCPAATILALHVSETLSEEQPKLLVPQDHFKAG